jgi:hypothetical protein
MTSQVILQTFKKSILKTDKQGLKDFLNRLRALEQSERESYIEKQTSYKRSTLAEYTADLESDNEYSRKHAQTRIAELQEDLERITNEASQKCEAKFILVQPQNKTTTLQGAIDEIIDSIQISACKSLDIYPSGNSFTRFTTVSISKNTGLSVDVDTDSMEFYENIQLQIPDAIRRISPRYHWVNNTQALISIYSLAALMPLLLSLSMSEPAPLPVSIVSVVLMFLVVISKFLLFPGVLITDEKTARRKILKSVGYVSGTLALSLIGSYIFWLILGK